MIRITAHSLSEEAAGKIRELIRLGKLETGQKIVESELSELLGISRTPLREALRSLSAEGLINLIPNKGAYVSQPSPEEVGELFQVMEILEGACARLAAENLTDETLARLEALHEELEKHYGNRDYEGYIRVNNEYHTFVQEVTRNKTLNTVINGIRQKVLLYRFRQLYVRNRFDHSIKEHRALLAAFRKRDPDEVERLMKEHLRRQGRALVESMG